MTGERNPSNHHQPNPRPQPFNRQTPPPRVPSPRQRVNPPVSPYRPAPPPPRPSVVPPAAPELPTVGHPIPAMPAPVDPPPPPRVPMSAAGNSAPSRVQPRRSPPPPPPTDDLFPDDDEFFQERRFRLRIPTHWQFWAIAGVITSMGVAGFSLAVLFKLPALPNCPSIFWPTASASLRLYCAELAANKQTVDDLLKAIALVDQLPDDHPLRPEIDKNIEVWSLDILKLAEQDFQDGNLDDAINTAEKIPTRTSAYTEVAERIDHWRSIWQEAETIYQQAEDAMVNEDLQQAFSIATRLLSVGNTYWETTKYQELNGLITASREDGNTLSRARGLARRGGLSNLKEAITLAQTIKPTSPAHAAAQRLVKELGQDMLDLASDTLDDGDSQTAIAIARQVPPEAGLQTKAQDFITLAMAVAQASGGTVSDLESAIVQAQRLDGDRPLSDRAQALVRRWQAEIQDVNHLELAQQLAEAGDTESLRSAIAEASQVPRSNPRGDEARRLVSQWTSAVETREDQPYLDRANQLAQRGDTTALQDAIAEASRIRSGRALYGDAQSRIQEWTSRVQRMQDQPYLDEARRLAANGNIPAAIATAQEIGRGRALYDDAQAAIQSWQAQTEGQTRMQQAYQTAGLGTPANLVDAIRTANQVPQSSTMRGEANRMIDVWSQQLLDLARQQAAYNLESAIAIASSIPPRTEAYAAAQLEIQTWQQQSAPPATSTSNTQTP